MPPSVDEWLPQRHLARFVVEVIEGLDLRAMTGSYRGSGEASYHPGLLLGLIIYGYATGVFSSRKLERATYDSVAFRFIAANEHPDHDTIAAFRRRFLKQIEPLFVQVLDMAREMGVLKLGTVALDGTKIHANASRHSALSYEHASKIAAQLQAEVADLPRKAEAADQADVPDGMSIPRNWRGVRRVWRRLPRHVRPSRRGRRSAMRGNGPSMRPSSRRARPRLRPKKPGGTLRRRSLAMNAWGGGSCGAGQPHCLPNQYPRRAQRIGAGTISLFTRRTVPLRKPTILYSSRATITSRSPTDLERRSVPSAKYEWRSNGPNLDQRLRGAPIQTEQIPWRFAGEPPEQRHTEW